MRRIIIVDNDTTFVEPLMKELSSFDVEVQWLKGANEFLKIVDRGKVDLYIITVELPDGNGFSLCKKVKEDANLRKIPVILVLRKENMEMAKNHQKLKTKADAYFTKPIDPKQFLGHIEDVMRAPLKKKKITEKVEVEVELEEHEMGTDVTFETTTVGWEEVDEEIERFVRRVSEFKSKVSALQAENERLKKRLKRRDMEVKELSEKIQELTNELEVKERKIREGEEEVRSLRREIEALNDEIRKERIEKKEIEAKVAKRAKEVEGLHKELKEMKLKLEKEVSLRSDALNEVNKLKQEVYTLRERETKLMKEKAVLEEESRRLKDILSELQEDKKVLEKALSELKEERDKVEKKLEALEAEKESLIKAGASMTPSVEEVEVPSEEGDEWLKIEEAVGEIDKIGAGEEEVEKQLIEEKESEKRVEEEESISAVEDVSEVVQEVGEVGGEMEEEVRLSEEGSVLGEDEEISKAIDDFFTQTEFVSKDSFEESLEFMLDSAKEDLASITTSEDKVSQKVAKIVDIYNHLFRYIFDKMKEGMPSSDPQRIFNDYFTDLKEEKAEIFKEVSFNENGELNSLSVARNTLDFVKEMSIPRSEIDRTAVSMILEVMDELLNFVKFTFSNILPDDVSEDVNNKAELLTSRIKALGRA